MAVAAEQAQVQTAQLEQKKERSATKKSSATNRRAALLSAQQSKAAADVNKAKALAKAKQDQLESMREIADTKLAAHEYRREEAIECKLSKLEKQAEHAKQVRRNKGTTMTEADNKLIEQASEKKPEQFDMLPERKPSPSPQKSAVQMRLESRAEAAAQRPGTSEDLVAEKLTKAEERKRIIEADKIAALASHAERVAAVQETQKAKVAEETALRRASLDHSLQVASARKERRLAADAEKASVEYTKAVELSAQLKDATGSAKQTIQTNLDDKLEKAERRRECPSTDFSTLSPSRCFLHESGPTHTDSQCA